MLIGDPQHSVSLEEYYFFLKISLFTTSFSHKLSITVQNGFVKRANFEWQVSSDHFRGWPMDGYPQLW